MKQLRILGGLTALFAALVTAQPAQAGFGHHRFGSYGSYGSSGGYGSSGYYASASYGSSGYASYGSSGAASYGSSGATYAASYGSSGAAYGSSGGYGSSGVAHVGPVRRLAAKIHAHHAAKVAARASYGSSGASYGSSGSYYAPSYGSSGSVSYGSSGSYVAPSYGSSGGGSSGSYVAPVYGSVYSETVISETPVVSSYRVPLETVAMDNDTALLTVAVEEGAVVTVNGLPTKSAGPIRQFMSNGLKEGFVYTYEVKVTYPGSEVADSKTVKLRAGSAERLVFSKPAGDDKTAAQAVAPETVVTIHVPENAKVVLAGNETNGEGAVRTFRTRQLAEGQLWSDYTIRVTATVRGTSVTKVKSIDLKAGDRQDLVFDFDTESVASR